MDEKPAGTRKSLVLASKSPRRLQLLREAGISFEAVAPQFEEPDPAGWLGGPEFYAESTSYGKASSVIGDHADCVVLGADTVVALNEQILGKPTNRDDARRILDTLSGSTHEVITGITILSPADYREITRHAVTQVTMRRMSDFEIEAYLAGGQWEGKAGAYGIQDDGDPFVTLVDGSFSNVVGLPMELVLELLAEVGIKPAR
ncbi:MAG TPA: Maf family protein [Phycisphaerae bacterium]|nr:Maf family protein [Phycisphaerae bacterium]HRY69510.1 Maf family protein [Phycisphaerae bacterium]HSA28186.1 Maf family protein [Phycisphaerae bacterium]